MKACWRLVCWALLIVCVASCKKDGSTEQYQPIVDPVVPDFSSRVNASVHGFITDERNNAVEGATVVTGTTTVVTDRYGYFSISNADFAKTAGFVKVSKAGYFKGFSSFLPVQGKQTFIRLKLLPLTTTGTIDAAGGGAVATSDGMRVALPANAVVNAANGNAYTGRVNVAIQWIDAADQVEMPLTMPGDLRGIDSTGYLNQLVSYGMAAVELTSEAGEMLQVANGKKATLYFPIPASLQASAPARIALWSFDEAKGLWKQEGFALRQGNEYMGDVGHFSYWNCDIGLPVVDFSAQLLDTALQPLANVGVAVEIANQPNSARIAYTDTNGFVYGMVPANSNLSLSVVAACNQRILFKTFRTVATAASLGSLVVQLSNYGATVSGTATKCNGNPVTDGYVLITSFGTNSFLPIRNGAFSASGTICSGAVASLAAFDRETGQQSGFTERSLQPGANALGNFVACNTPTTESISIVVDGVLSNYTLPQYLFGGNYYFANDSTQLNALDLLNGNQTVFAIGFIGGAAGAFPLSNNRVQIGSTIYQFTTPVTVSISAYGLIGQFISGSFSGTATEPATAPATHTVSVSFNIKRDQ